MDEKRWREYVRKYDGAFVIWVDQGTDPLVKDRNLEGICFVMAFDFVTAFQGGEPGPSKFINDFHNALLISQKKNRIPEKYIDLQISLQKAWDQYRQNLIVLDNELKQASEEDKPEIINKIKKCINDRIEKRYGQGMRSYNRFKEQNGVSAQKIFDQLKVMAPNKAPCYFIVEMMNDKNGHALAFGFRPDLSGTEKFPDIYEYFDPNLGFFQFGSEEKLFKFFTTEVWQFVYSKSNFPTVEIASFTPKTNIR
jgi:hypothetical protein